MPSAPRQQRAPAPRAGRLRLLPGLRPAERLLAVAIAVIILIAGLSSVGGTYAMWADQAEVNGGTITSGTASLTADWDAGYGEDDWYNLLPGQSVQQHLDLTNTGSVPMELSATVPAAVPGVEIRAEAATAAGSLTSPALGAGGRPLDASDAPGTPLVIEPGQKIDITVEITATDALIPAAEIVFAVQFDGSQTR